MEKAKSFLVKVLKQKRMGKVGPQCRTVLAEACYLVLADKEQAEKWLDSVGQPDIQRHVLSYEKGMNPFLFRFRLNRMLYALGKRQSLKQLVPDAEDPKEQVLVYFERHVCLLAHVWAGAWLNEAVDGQEVRQLLRFFYRRPSGHNYHWYNIQGARDEFHELLIRAMSEYGGDTVTWLRDAIHEEWDSDEPRKFWSAHTRRSIILALGLEQT